jgi:hypothetical protein
VDQEWKARRFTCSGDHSLVTSNAQWGTSLGHEDIGAALAFTLQAT